MTAVTETLLYMASRAQLVEEVVSLKLKAGKIVLCDRWLDATVAYQGYGAGVDAQWIAMLGKVATYGLTPVLSIFLDLPLECGLRRAKKRHAADRIEKKSLEFHQRVRKGYLAIAQSDPKRFKRIQIYETDSITQTHEKIKRLVDRVI